MTSETPKDGTPAVDAGVARRPGTQGEDTPGSLGLENVEPSSAEDFDDTGYGIGMDSDGESVNFLTAGERKLSLGEQRQILAGRRRTNDDDIEMEVLETRTGRREMRERMHQKARGIVKADGTKAEEPGAAEPGSPGAVSAAGAETSSPSSATATPTTNPVPGPGTAPGGTALLNDPANPNKPLFDAVLKGVGDLDPARVALTPAEQTNVAAALTAGMTQTQGFPREQSDVVQVSVAASDKGDRVFAINGQNPDAPNAVYISVAVEQARAQPLDVSTAQAIAPQQQELQPPKPMQEQSATMETPVPRAVV